MKKLFHQDEPVAGDEASANTRSNRTVRRRIDIFIEREVISITCPAAQLPTASATAAKEVRSGFSNELPSANVSRAIDRTAHDPAQTKEQRETRADVRKKG